MSNPVFSEAVFHADERGVASSTMTPMGAITKTLILTGILTVVAVFTGHEFVQNVRSGAGMLVWGLPAQGVMIGGMIVGLLCVLGGCFIPAMAAPASLAYAVVKGVVVGIVSMLYGLQEGMHGLPLMAAALTLATLFGMLLLYQLRIIRVTNTLRSIIIGATFGLVVGIGGLWLVSMFGFGGGLLGTLYGSGPIGIGFSVVCVGLAAFNLLLDFDFIERGSQAQMPKKYEWVAALGLLVTLVWLYLELLRLLSKLRR